MEHPFQDMYWILKKNGLSQRGGGRGGSACLCENSQTLINLLKGTFPYLRQRVWTCVLSFQICWWECICSCLHQPCHTSLFPWTLGWGYHLSKTWILSVHLSQYHPFEMMFVVISIKDLIIPEPRYCWCRITIYFKLNICFFFFIG